MQRHFHSQFLAMRKDSNASDTNQARLDYARQYLVCPEEVKLSFDILWIRYQ